MGLYKIVTPVGTVEEISADDMLVDDNCIFLYSGEYQHENIVAIVPITFMVVKIE